LASTLCPRPPREEEDLDGAVSPSVVLETFDGLVELELLLPRFVVIEVKDEGAR
jgi:hypothetical protein